MVERDSVSGLTDALFDVLGVLYAGKCRDDANRQRMGVPTWAQDLVLATLQREGPTRVTNLAAYVGVTTPTMTVAVDRLVRQGMVRRFGDPADGRIVIVAITSRGRRRYAEAVVAVRVRLAERLRAMSVEERRALRDAVSALDVLADLASPPRSVESFERVRERRGAATRARRKRSVSPADPASPPKSEPAR